MDENTWLASTDPREMLEWLTMELPGYDEHGLRVNPPKHPPSDRKLWLFVLAMEMAWWGNVEGIDVKSCKILEAIAEDKLPDTEAYRVYFSYAIPRPASA